MRTYQETRVEARRAGVTGLCRSEREGESEGESEKEREREGFVV